MLMMIMITTSITFMMMNHPMSAGMVLMVQTTLMAMTSGMMSTNFWFSYILFMIMVGGMLVLLIYMTSVASNEKFKFSLKIIMIASLMMIMTTIFKEQIKLTIENKSTETMMMSSNSMFQLSMSKYLSNNLMYWMISMIMYLLMALIATVKITEVKYGPLRQKQ